MAAYTPYELWRILIERVGWRNEEEKLAAIATVDEWERMGIFGNLVNMVACPHEETKVVNGGRAPITVCLECKRVL